MGGTINFRDFGGQLNTQGLRVRSGRLYRCGHLAGLNSSGVQSMLALDFSVVADLRYRSERERERSPWPSTYGERLLSHDGERNTAAPHIALLNSGALSVESVDSFYLRLYRDLPFDPLYRPLFAQAILRIAESEGRALVHCAAGKDRTGILCALILHCLDLPRESIIADYLRSSGSRDLLAMAPKLLASARRRHAHASEDAVRQLLDVRPSYLEASFQVIDERCGSVATYLDGSGVGPDAIACLQKSLLEPAAETT